MKKNYTLAVSLIGALFLVVLLTSVRSIGTNAGLGNGLVAGLMSAVQSISVGTIRPISTVQVAQPVVKNADGTVKSTTPATTVSASTIFKRNLQVGSTGSDVQYLQRFLNAKGFTIVASGAGSLGNETTYFGNLTGSALSRYQQSVGLAGTGVLDGNTINAIGYIVGDPTSPPPQTTHIVEISETWPYPPPADWPPNHQTDISQGKLKTPIGSHKEAESVSRWPGHEFKLSNQIWSPNHIIRISSAWPNGPHPNWPANHTGNISSTWPADHNTLVSYNYWPPGHKSSTSLSWPPGHTDGASGTWPGSHEPDVSLTFPPLHQASYSHIPDTHKIAHSQSFPPNHEWEVSKEKFKPGHDIVYSRKAWPDQTIPPHDALISNTWPRPTPNLPPLRFPNWPTPYHSLLTSLLRFPPNHQVSWSIEDARPR